MPLALDAGERAADAGGDLAPAVLGVEVEAVRPAGDGDVVPFALLEGEQVAVAVRLVGVNVERGFIDFERAP